MTDTPKESPPAKGARTTVDRFIEASGVRKKSADPRQDLFELGKKMDESFKAMMAEADEALQAAKDTRVRTESMFNQLKNFCSITMPAEMKKALESIAQESLLPLQDQVRKTVNEIENSRMTADIYWGFRMFTVLVVTGVAVAVVAFAVLYHYFFSERYDEVKRYAKWGRKVEAEFQKLPPKHREKVFAYYGKP